MQISPILPSDHGITLKNWLKANKPALTRALIEKGLRKGWIKVNGKSCELSTILSAGDKLGLSNYLSDIKENEKITKNFYSVDKLKWIEKAIVYQDKEMLVLNKPAGLAVQGGSGQKENLDDMLKAWAKEGEALRLVHRLDRDTSGLLILAKSAESARNLAKLFASKDVEKRYTALIVGVPKQRKGRIDMKLAKRQAGKDSAMERVKHYEDGKEAITEYEITEYYANKLAWVRLTPITGRTHQLRVHMATLGHPIVGDGKYGGAMAFVKGIDIKQQLHLHAAEITLPREGKKPLTLTAPLPAHMAHARKVLA